MKEMEIGVVGDLITAGLVTPAHPHPLKGVVGRYGLKSEHFEDDEVRGAFAAVMEEASDDPAVLGELIVRKSGIEFYEEAVNRASALRHQAEERIRLLAETGRKRLMGEALSDLILKQRSVSEHYFISMAEQIVRGTSAAARGDGLVAESVEDFLKDPPPALDPIVRDCFEGGDKVELIAPSKCRKSFWALDLALHVAAGAPFSGLVIPRERRVLLVNLEIKRDWMKRRVVQRLEGYGLTLAQLGGRLKLMNCRGMGETVREAILSRVMREKPELVIIDPRYKLMRQDEDENSGNGLIGILNLLDAIAEQGAAVMIVSHDKKGDVKTQDIRDRGAGSNWAARDVDCRFVMTPMKNDDYGVSLAVLARNYPPKAAIGLRAEYGNFKLI